MSDVSERHMSWKDIMGLVLCSSAALAAMLGYKILGTAWNVGFAVLGSVGLWLLWSAQRERRLSLWAVDDFVAEAIADYGGDLPDVGDWSDSA